MEMTCSVLHIKQNLNGNEAQLADFLYGKIGMVMLFLCATDDTITDCCLELFLLRNWGEGGEGGGGGGRIKCIFGHTSVYGKTNNKNK